MKTRYIVVDGDNDAYETCNTTKEVEDEINRLVEDDVSLCDIAIYRLATVIIKTNKVSVIWCKEEE